MVGKKLRFAQTLYICFLPIFEDGQGENDMKFIQTCISKALIANIV